jgi:membrane protein YdbS with pleckstrin-like domain
MDRPEPDPILTDLPAGPAAPVEPVESAEPGAPAASVEPAVPVEPTASVEPAVPVEPVDPRMPVEPAEPAGPAGSLESAATDESAVPGVPVESPAPVEPPALPREAPVQRLDPRVVNLWRVGGAVWTAIWTGATGGAAALLDWPLSLMIPVAVLGIAWTAWVPAAAYRHSAYQVGDVDVRVIRGWWTRAVAVVLHSRIQHVDTRQGPIERAMGLATVVIFTAGSVGAMVAIPGIAEKEAEALRDLLARLSGAEDAV